MKTLPLAKALQWILISIILVSGSVTLAWLYFDSLEASRLGDSHYTIRYVRVEHPKKGARLNPDLFCELLGLSSDRPLSLYAFQPSEAAWVLEQHPLVARASCSRRDPDTVEISYALRQPYVRLLDWTRTGVDREGYVIPLLEGIDYQQLPAVYLGVGRESTYPWGSCVQGAKWEQLLAILMLLKDSESVMVDLSRLHAENLGKREILVTLRAGGILRLPVEGYEEALKNYSRLCAQLPDLLDAEFCTVDLRLPTMALVGLNPEVHAIRR